MTETAKLFAQEGSLPLHRRERRPVTLAGFAGREDGSAMELTLIDLSFDGCGVICTSSLVAGERLSLSVVGRGTAAAIVRWVDGARAGLSFLPAEHRDVQATQARSHERRPVDGEVVMRRSGKISFRVRVYDLSPHGCKAEFVERPGLNEQLWIRFDGLEALEARVRWISGARAGLRFVRPLHPAVFDLTLARLGPTRPHFSAA